MHTINILFHEKLAKIQFVRSFVPLQDTKKMTTATTTTTTLPQTLKAVKNKNRNAEKMSRARNNIKHGPNTVTN